MRARAHWVVLFTTLADGALQRGDARAVGGGAPHPWTRRGDVLRAAAAITGAATLGLPAAQANPPVDLQKPSELVLYTPPSVKGKSSSEQLQLAEHLKKSGATMYGAYWCSHCYQQKVAFGAGGTQLLGYVECAADGYNSQRQLCQEKGIRGYPTWEIGGTLYPGERSLVELAKLSGFPEPGLFASEEEDSQL